MRTDQEVVEDYVNNIIDEIKINPEEFLLNFISPIDKDPLKILSGLQSAGEENEDQSQINPTGAEDTSSSSVLPVELYVEVERNR